jgi:hypothetical protein
LRRPNRRRNVPILKIPVIFPVSRELCEWASTPNCNCKFLNDQLYRRGFGRPRQCSQQCDLYACRATITNRFAILSAYGPWWTRRSPDFDWRQSVSESLSPSASGLMRLRGSENLLNFRRPRQCRRLQATCDNARCDNASQRTCNNARTRTCDNANSEQSCELVQGNDARDPAHLLRVNGNSRIFHGSLLNKSFNRIHEYGNFSEPNCCSAIGSKVLRFPIGPPAPISL